MSRRWLIIGCLSLLPVAVSGCAQTIARNGITDAKVASTAEVPGMSGIRFWADEVPEDPIKEIRKRVRHLPPIAKYAARVKDRRIIETLALSGGGADGAFGAGVLEGWTERGDRPEFEVVTGVSAGAIIAPFAFLGPSEDGKLRAIWTQYKQDEVITTQFLPALFGGPAFADTSPLRALIAKYIDRDFVDRVGAQYRRGRILMVLTTNLDAQRPVVWNMGEIALNRSPQAVDLFRKVILASSAIPAAFPPVKIEVEADGRYYDELHVDGGTTRELFVLPVQAPLKSFDSLYPAPPIRRFFIIKNGKVSPEQQVTQATTLKIAARSISTLIKSQNQSELYRIYRIALDGGADFNFIAVPDSFNRTTKQIIDPVYQAALYKEGVKEGRKGIWMKAPPGQTPISLPPPSNGRDNQKKPPNNVGPSVKVPKEEIKRGAPRASVPVAAG